MKKISSILFIFLSMLFVLGSITFSNKIKGYAKEEDNKTMNTKYLDENITSKSGILIDEKTGNILYAKNHFDKLPIASMCKIMTLLLCYEQIDNGNLSLDEEITVSENASGMGGSQVFLETNGIYKVSELLKSITIASANDACVAMAERICGSEDLFTDLMNQKAKELEMNNTVFVNCTGLPCSGQYSCANDVAIMFRELVKHKLYFNYSKIWMDEIKHPHDRKTVISNTNKLIRFFDGCEGGKTGYTNEAGHCLTAIADRKGVRVISVIIGAKDSSSRFEQTKILFNYAFANYECKRIIDSNSKVEKEISVINGKKNTVNCCFEKPYFVLTQKNSKINYEFNYVIENNIKAPITKGQVIGKLEIYQSGQIVNTVNIISDENIDKKNYSDNINEIIDNWTV